MNGFEDFALFGGLFGFINDEIEEAKRKREERERHMELEMGGTDCDDPPPDEVS